VVDNFEIYNEDCITGMPAHVEPESVGLCVTSIPFGALFTYSGKNEDIGNNPDGVDLEAGQFGLHMRFWFKQLYDCMMPGRNVCIHIQQLLTTIVQHGAMGRRDFRGAVIQMAKAAGFQWPGELVFPAGQMDTEDFLDAMLRIYQAVPEFVIPKDPQAIAQRHNLHSLQFMTGYGRDACKLAPAVNDYVLIFQKPGENPAPVRCLHERKKNPGGWVSQEEWIRWARGVWSDIEEIDVLEGWHRGRDKDDEKHVCPLQLSVIQRCIRLYTNPGDLVLDPFMGIGSTAWVALGGKARDGVLDQPRRVIGFELKESYHAIAVKNAGKALSQQEGLFAGGGRGKCLTLK
jgi:hypothetical protein